MVRGTEAATNLEEIPATTELIWALGWQFILTEHPAGSKRGYVASTDAPEVMERFEAELGLVNSVVGHVSGEMGGLLDENEMISFGQEGLFLAAQRYDPTMGIPFKSYAYHRVRGAILDGIRKHGRLQRRAYEKLVALRTANLLASGFYEDNAVTSHRLDEKNADDQLADHLANLATAMAVGISGMETTAENGERVIISPDRPDEDAERMELVRLVHEYLEELTEQEAMFIRQHFFEGRGIAEISREMGLSRSWGSRVLARGLTKLSKRLRAAS